MSACRQYTLTQIKAEILCLVLLLVWFFFPAYLTARLALLLCIDVDGGLVDTCECVVPWIVSGGTGYVKINLNHSFQFIETSGNGKKGIYFHIQNGL